LCFLFGESAVTERELFAQALQIESAAQRATFLDQACGGDAALRGRVDGLLSEHENLGSYLEVPAAAMAVATIEPAIKRPGARIGRYRLLEQLGEGGMGTVWVAEQTEPVKRRVALKLIKPGMDTRQVLSRFEAERQALAVMDHPNIAKVFDGGMTEEGRPYFVMEYVKGVPITEYCDNARLSIRERLDLFVPVCQAVQHAHQKGIIHRDLKPSNILVCLYDGIPIPKVIDFGLAKAISQPLTEHTLYTAHGLMVGTPLYMSPEQAEFNNLDVDTRTDIYSLGVILYELFTGTTPLEKRQFKDAALQEILRLIKEVEPPKPSAKLSSSASLPSIAAQRSLEPAQLSRLVRGDLDWIVMKSLEKDRSRRYETANGLARDIARYLNDEPVEASPPSAAYRLQKFVRRNKRTLATAALVGLMLMVTCGALVWQTQERWRRQAEADRKLAATEQGIGQALDQAAQARAALHAALRGPGGVQELLNQPARWEVLHKTAYAALGQAKVLAAGTDGRLALPLSQRLEELDRELAADEADFQLALRLEEIRLEAATWTEGQFNSAGALREYPLAFVEAGLAIEPGRKEHLAVQIARSAIKDQLLAALDDWALHARRKQQLELAHAVLAVARLADQDPWRDQVRDPARWNESQTTSQSAQQAQRDPDLLASLTPQMIVAISWRLPAEEGATWLRKAQALHPADFWINFDLAQRLRQVKGKDHEAIGFYRAALAARPNNTAVLNNLGVALADTKDLPAAIDTFNRALAIDPQFTLAWNNLSNTLRKQKDLPAAIDVCKKALAINPRSASTWNNLGHALLDQTDVPAAIDAYNKALAIDSQYAYAWNGIGNALLDQKDFAAAIDAYRRALAIDPQLAQPWYNLGNALRDQKDLPAAIDAFKSALAIDPEYVEAWVNLGNVQRIQKNLPAAIEAYRKALAINSQFAPAWENLGNAFNDQKNLPAAIEAHRKALSIDPEAPTASLNLGLDHRALAAEYWKSGRLEEAEKHFKQALELHETVSKRHSTVARYQRDCGATLNELALITRDQNRLEEAQEMLEQAIRCQQAALKLDANDELSREFLGRHYANLGHVFLRLKERSKAELTASELARLFPPSPSRHYDAASILAGCAILAEVDASLNNEQRQELARFFADRAVELLGQAIKYGWKNAQQLKQNSNFAPLRARKDFTKLVAELDDTNP
jgi:serine/threonine protein kinase/Tfp pilus assembly protein PilF